MMRPVFLGVDCGGTSLRVAAADASGTIIGESVVATCDAQEEENGLGQAIVALISDLVSGLAGKMDAIAGIGVGLPFVCWEGKAHLARNVKALDPPWLEESLHGRYRAPVALLNDVKCAALGEEWLGVAKGAQSFVFVNVGTGLSSAFYSGGQVLHGAHHAAGEIGYWVAEADDPKGFQDGIGALEQAMSGVGIADAWRERSGKPHDAGAEEIFRLASSGDVLAAGIIHRGLQLLFPAVANLATLLDPELIVLGGGVSRSLAAHGPALEAYVRHMTPFPPRIAFSTLGGRAGLLGSIRLAMRIGQ